jgi:hypothetical protein
VDTRIEGIASKAVTSRDEGKLVGEIRETPRADRKNRTNPKFCSKGLLDNACQYSFTRDLQVGLAAVVGDQRYKLRSDNRRYLLSLVFGSI